MFNREIGNAPPRVELIGRGKRIRGADILTGRAAAAMVLRRRVRVQLQSCENRPYKGPIAKLTAQQIGMFALPTQPSGLCQCLFRHRCGIHEHFDLARFLFNQPPRQPLEAFLDDIMIIATLCIDRHGRAVRVFQHRQRIMFGRVTFRQHDHRSRLWPKRGRVAPPRHPIRHPTHIPVISDLHKGSQTLRHLRHIPRATDPRSHKPPI